MTEFNLLLKFEKGWPQTILFVICVFKTLVDFSSFILPLRKGEAASLDKSINKFEKLT